MHNADPKLVARYFDHGATSFPKPSCVAQAMADYVDKVGGTYGRSAYSQAHKASSIVFETRERLAQVLGAGDSSHVAFTMNATAALNIAIQGMVKPGGTVLVSPMEHNSVMRPLTMMAARRGIEIKNLPHQEDDGTILADEIKVDEKVCLAVVCHQSNVNGVIQPIADIKAKLGRVPLLVDAAQSAGEVPIEAASDGIDLIAVAGHKYLLGPTGTGALYVNKSLDLPPLLPGGTGSWSESIEQPVGMPDALEGGTPNIAGLAGLGAAISYLEENGPTDRGDMTNRVLRALKRREKITVYRAVDPFRQGNLFSFNIVGISCSQVAMRLWTEHGFAVRAGLHCSPSAHQLLGTLDYGGTVRVSFGRYQTDEDADRLIDALTTLAN